MHVVIVGDPDTAAQISALLLSYGTTSTTVFPPSEAKSVNPVAVVNALVNQQARAVVDAVDIFDPRSHPVIEEAARATGSILVGYSPEPLPEAAQGYRVMASAEDAAHYARRNFHHVLIQHGGAQLNLKPFVKDPDNLYVFRPRPADSTTALPQRSRVVATPTQHEDVAQERKFLRDNQIDGIVVFDTGDQSVASTLAAAQALGIEVLIVARPDPWGSYARRAQGKAQLVRVLLGR